MAESTLRTSQINPNNVLKDLDVWFCSFSPGLVHRLRVFVGDCGKCSLVRSHCRKTICVHSAIRVDDADVNGCVGN